MKKVKLKDYIQQINGVSYKPTDIYDHKCENSCVLLRASNISNGNLNYDDVINVDIKRVSTKQYLQQGDILICTSSGSKHLVGKASFIKENTHHTFGAFCKVIRITSNLLYPKYLAHFMQSDRYHNEIYFQCNGANINNIRNEHIDNLEIPLPSLAEQEAIVKKLDSIEKLISARKSELDKLDLLIKAKFNEMFESTKLPYTNKDFTLIKNIATVVSGSTPKTNEEENWNGKLNWITPAEIKEDDFIITNTHRTITEKGAQSCSLKILPINTILLSSRAPIGKVAIVGKEMYCNQGFKNLICNTKINPYYMYFLLKNNSIYLNSLGRGATFKEISKSIVENIQIYVPPIELQNQFADFVNKVNELKDKVNASLTSLTLLKKQQMQKYFG